MNSTTGVVRGERATSQSTVFWRRGLGWGHADIFHFLRNAQFLHIWKCDVWHLFFFHALMCPILDSQERSCGWVIALDPQVRPAFTGV